MMMMNSLSKLFEYVLFDLISSSSNDDDYQFGFKKKHSTGLCTFSFKHVLDYYRQNGSHVFACFIDFKKAFDYVDYWLLFSKLLDSSDTPACLLGTRVLAHWYSHQQSFIRWHNETSECFNIGNGVRQGGVLSPYLFSFYIRSLISTLISSETGCYIGNTCFNIFAYADDIVLLAPSWLGLQNLLNVVQGAASDIDMIFNTKKTVCMVFNPIDKSKIVSLSFPKFVLNGQHLSYVSDFRYLGHIIDESGSDDKDIKREIRSLFARTNILNSRFKKCSIEVKLKLFKCYCMCFYDVELWNNYSTTIFNRLNSCYIKCIKTFFGFAKYSSVTSMMFLLGLPTMNTIMFNTKFRFKQRLNLSSCFNNTVEYLCKVTYV